MHLPSFIALRYLRSKQGDRFGRLVTKLASIGIVLGVIALILILSIMNGLEKMQKEALLTQIPHAIVQPLEGNFAREERLALPDFVRKQTPITQTRVVIQGKEGIQAGTLIGVQSANDAPQLSGLQTASLLKAGEFQLLISQRLAQQLKLNIHDKVRLLITDNSRYTPFGRVPVQRLFTVAGIYPANDDESTLFTSIDDVGKLLHIPSNEAQGVRLFLNDPFDVTKLAQAFPENRFKLQDWRAQKGEFFQAVKMEKNMMGLLIALIILVAMSNIVTSISLMVVDKRNEIAILQTQGFNKRQIRLLFILQGSFVGVFSTLIGTLIGILLSLSLGAMLSSLGLSLIRLPAEINAGQVAAIFFGTILFTVLCTLYPATQAAKIQPASVLRGE